MKEKTTKGTTETDQGLNEGNPNTERTPVDNRKIEGVTGGIKQSNYTDEQQGDTAKTTKDRERESD